MLTIPSLKQCSSQFNLLKSSKNWTKIKWMNEKALPGQAYIPTPIENFANVITHGIGIIPSILATLELFQRSDSGAKIFSALIYGSTLICLFGVSTAFHCSCLYAKPNHLKDVLHRCDRAMIYVFIAGSYYPWLTLESLPQNGWASSMNWIVWFLAFLGIVYQQTFHEKYKELETMFYVVIGILPAILVMKEHQFSGIFEIQLGGLSNLVGLMFFKSDGKIPCAHAIWHLFSMLTTSIHYFAVLNYLYPNPIDLIR